LKTQDYQVIWLSENQDNRKRMSGCGRAARHVERLTLIETSCATYKRTTKLNNLLYNCRESSTNRPLFMQNKANLGKSQMDVRLNISRDYEKKPCWTFGENKPNQSQFQTLPLWIPKNQTQTKPISNLTLLKWVISRENALDTMASATKNACLMGLNKNRKKEANAAVYTFNQAVRLSL